MVRNDIQLQSHASFSRWFATQSSTLYQFSLILCPILTALSNFKQQGAKFK